MSYCCARSRRCVYKCDIAAHSVTDIYTDVLLLHELARMCLQLCYGCARSRAYVYKDVLSLYTLAQICVDMGIKSLACLSLRLCRSVLMRERVRERERERERERDREKPKGKQLVANNNGCDS